MKLRSLPVFTGMLFAGLAFAGAALAPLSASAQTGLYVNPIAIRVTNSVADQGLYAFLGQNSTAATFWGVNFGVYYDFKSPHNIHAGLDMRDSIVHANGALLNNYLVGVRIAHKTADSPFKPYIEPVVGQGQSHAPDTVIRVKKVEYGVYAGLDYETHHHIDFRLVELGYTNLLTASSTTLGGVGSGKAVPSSNLFSISTGLVLRFP